MSAIRQWTAKCIRSFQTLSTALLAHDVVFRSMINTEALEDEQGRFRVWSGNLGALQKGHSSLDYRLRDSPLLQTNVLKLLNELGTNLSEALAIVSGDRLPYEQQPKPDESEDGDDVWSQDEDSGEDEAPKTELEQRFLDIVDIVDNLYKLSVRIRSPTLRSRSLKAASYRPVDPDTGIDIFEQYALFDLQHTRELLSHLRSGSSDQKNEEDNYLIERLSKALTLRRRQFKYWRRHRDKLGTSSDIGDIRPQLLSKQQEDVEIGTPADKTTGDKAVNVIKAPTSEWMPKSLLSGTEATQHHHSLDEVVDNQSVTSYATTTRDLTGRGIELPSPPKAATGERDFECPYCFIICPARYGKGRAWRAHILQDLQPYVCTSKDCKGSDQLFRSRREWSEHEAGHRKLWRCPEHINAVFRSSSNLEDHLHREHPGSFPEEQLSSIIRVGETSAIDLRKACPICFVAITMEGGLQNHIANHLERLAVFALPKDINSAEDESDVASSAASRGRIVGSSASQHLRSESSYSDSISIQSDNAAYLDSDLASKISRLTSETQALGSETVPLNQEVTNALSADLLTLLPDASNQKMDTAFLWSQQYSEVAFPESISSEPGNPIRDDHLELQKQSANGPEDADWPSTAESNASSDLKNQKSDESLRGVAHIASKKVEIKTRLGTSENKPLAGSQNPTLNQRENLKLPPLEKEQTLVVKLKYGRKHKKEVERYLRLPPSSVSAATEKKERLLKGKPKQPESSAGRSKGAPEDSPQTVDIATPNTTTESKISVIGEKRSRPDNDSVSHGSSVDNILPELPELQADRQQTLPTAPIPIPRATTLEPTEAEASPSPDPPQDIYIAVMGQTGTGKTSFIQDATGKELKVGHTLSSCTQNIEEVRTSIDGRTIKFIDTPGFDDSWRSDTDVLELIGTYLQKAYTEKIFLTGIIYLWRITDVRMQGSTLRSLRILKKLCGPKNYGNIVLATTKWDEVNPEEGEYREKQLKNEDEYWAELIKEGATVRRHNAGKESAISIVKHLLDKALEETLEERTERLQKEIERLQKELEVAKQEKGRRLRGL